MIGYSENFFTLLIGVLYPLYFSIKSLREKKRENIKSWLHYWIIYSIFLNIEYIFSYFVINIPLYFFYKLVFLIVCFLPQYKGAKYFYTTFIKDAFIKYENDVCEISATIAEKIRKKLLDSDEENECEECEDGEE